MGDMLHLLSEEVGRAACGFWAITHCIVEDAEQATCVECLRIAARPHPSDSERALREAAKKLDDVARRREELGDMEFDALEHEFMAAVDGVRAALSAPQGGEGAKA
jgi:hypothetical protein